MFTVIFAIPRTSGWVAQWMELNEDEDQKIARPRQIYTGEREREYLPIAERSGPEKITGAAGPAAEAGPPRRLSTLGFRLTIRHGPRVSA